MSNPTSKPASKPASPENSIEDLCAHDGPPSARARPSASIIKRHNGNPSGAKSSSAAASTQSSRASSPSQPLRSSVTTASASTPTSPNNALSGISSMQMTPLSSELSSPVAGKLPQFEQLDGSRVSQRSEDGSSQQQITSSGIKSPVSASRRNSAASVKQPDAENIDPNPTTLTSRLLSFGNNGNEGQEELPSRKAGAGISKIPRGPSGMAPRLETVQEGDQSTPPKDTVMSAGTIPRPPSIRQKSTVDASELQSTEAGQDGQPKKTESSEPATKVGMKTPARKSSTASLPPLKNRQQPSESGSTKTMTVETETVTSIPQAQTTTSERGGGGGRSDLGGGLRAKKSSETIRPKKEKRKPSRKAPVSTVGTSKADLFEAKVASAVDQDESDSDETFVYESNPLEPRHRHHHPHHSRTPSTNSTRSFADRRGGVRPLTQLEPQRAVTGKRSMKFASSASYASSSMDEDENEHEGRATTGRKRASHSHRHNPHRTYMEADSPFSQARLSSNKEESKSGSRRGSPKSTTSAGPRTLARKPDGGPDLDDKRVEDEGSPLLGTVRQNPRYYPKRYTHLRNVDVYLEESPKRSFSRCVCCTLAILLGIIVVLAIVGFTLLTSKPLESVHVTQIRNVLASEQEIMFDIVVHGLNPNVLSITASDCDINIFARSKFVGSDRFWREHGFPEPTLGGGDASQPKNRTSSKSASISESKSISMRGGFSVTPITDPDPSSSEKATMLLGRVFEFDTAVTFAPSPLAHRMSGSVGEMRLAHPGNKTETGGTQRWESVLEHPFDLIVRGIMYYQLPLTTTRLTASLAASVLVTPDSSGKGFDVVVPQDQPSSEFDEYTLIKKSTVRRYWQA